MSLVICDALTQSIQPLPRLGFLRTLKPTSFEAAVYDPVLIVVLAGKKETVLGTDSYPMRAGECLLVSHDLPVIARVIKAPYLALLFSIDLDTLRELYEAIAEPTTQPPRSISVQKCEPKLLEALERYVALTESKRDAAVLGAAVAREIHYRLVTAPFGSMLRDLIRYDSHASAVARAIHHLRLGFREPLEVPALARSVGMSTSAFHKHFKAITASSPLQYRKGLQLLEARRMLRAGKLAVTKAAFEVGYESAAQFSRDYARKFGASPKHDLPLKTVSRNRS